MRFTTFLPALLFATSVFANAQQSHSALSFEVASIKPAEPQMTGRMRVGQNADSTMIHYVNVSLLDCIRVAYGVKEFQISGPSWLGSDRFDIEAKYPSGATEDQVPEMLQSLLANRFKLKVHRGTKEHAIYALVVGKNGAKLKPADIDTHEQPETAMSQGNSSSPDQAAHNSTDAGRTARGPGVGGERRGATMMMMASSGLHLVAPAVTLDNICDTLSRFSNRPIVNETGIQGRYNFDLVFKPENMSSLPGGSGGPKSTPMGGAADGAELQPEPGASIFDAVQQYGLKLESRKGSMSQIIVDHIEKTPTEN